MSDTSKPVKPSGPESPVVRPPAPAPAVAPVAEGKRPETKVRWDGDNIFVEEKGAGGDRKVYVGPLTKELTALLTGLGVEIPRKRTIVKHLDQKVIVQISGPNVDDDNRAWYDVLYKDVQAELAAAAARLGEKYPELTIGIK